MKERTYHDVIIDRNYGRNGIAVFGDKEGNIIGVAPLSKKQHSFHHIERKEEQLIDSRRTYKKSDLGSFKSFIGVILVIMLFNVLSGFAGYIGTYGQVYERDYVTQSYINEDYTVDMTGFNSYCEMTVPSPSITQGILPKVQAISILVDNVTPMSMEFEEWSAINTPNLYALRNGTGLERGIWNFCSMFTKIYFNIFVKFCHIPQIFEVIGTLLK